MGYVTGRNFADTAVVGSTTDGQGIMGQVKLICDADPTLSLTTAVERVYADLARKKR